MITMAQEESHKSTFTKTFLPTMTGMMSVAGLIMFIAGVWVMNKEIIYAEISTSLSIQTAPIILLVAGILSLLVAGLGVYFIRYKLNLNGGTGKPLIIIIVLLIILVISAILALVAGGYGVNHTKKVKDTFETDLMEKIRVYGRTGQSMKDVDRLQEEDKCCGVHSYADWRITIYAGHRYDKVPDSCCKQKGYACGYEFEDEDELNRKGCVTIAVDKMNRDLKAVGVIGITFGIIEVILWICLLSCYLCNKEGKDEYQQTPSEHPPSPSSEQVPKETVNVRGGGGSGQSKVTPTAQEVKSSSSSAQGGATLSEKEGDKPGVQGGGAPSGERDEKLSKQQTTYC